MHLQHKKNHPTLRYPEIAASIALAREQEIRTIKRTKKLKKKTMNSSPMHIHFDKSIPQVREPKLNPYGFDLTDEAAIVFYTGKLKFTILGFKPSNQYDTLIATVKVSLNPHVNDEYAFVQKIDLYYQDRLNTYCRTAAFVLRMNEEEIKKGICTLRERLEKYRIDELKRKTTQTNKLSINENDQKEAMNILKADNLMECIEGLLKQAGVVTEIENSQRLFLILLSRHFDKPLHVLFQGSPQLSRMLMDTVSATIPEEQLHTQTSMSAHALYYTQNKNYWKNKVLSIGNINKQFKAANTIKEFIENQILKHYTIESDYLTRQLYSSNRIVEGAICLLGYSEEEKINNKYFQECFFIRLDENEKNKKEMLQHLKEESTGQVDSQKQEEARQTLMTIQRLIRPMQVIIPYAMQLELPEQVFQPLRSFSQLLTFIKTITLLHQHQLKIKKDKYGTEYIEATAEHLEIAIELFKSLLITQSDMISPSQRSFLEQLKAEVRDKDQKFKIPEMMQALKMKRTTFYREFNVLKELRYVIPGAGNKKSGIEYKILQWDDYTELQNGANLLDEQLKKIKSGIPVESQQKKIKAKPTKNKDLSLSFPHSGDKVPFLEQSKQYK